MGLYWATYLCEGRFEDADRAKVTRSLRFPSINQMIEEHEWRRGRVDLAEAMVVANDELHVLICPSPAGHDVFLKETVWGTLTEDHSESKPRYVLVARQHCLIPMGYEKGKK